MLDRQKALSMERKNIFLGKNKEVFDVELWAILDALDIITKETLNINNKPIQNFGGSQKALKAMQHFFSCKENWVLRGLIYRKAEKLQSHGHSIVFGWISGHSGLIGNEKFDLAAKNRAERGGKETQRWNSLVYIKKNLAQAWSKELTKRNELNMQEEKSAAVAFKSYE